MCDDVSTSLSSEGSNLKGGRSQFTVSSSAFSETAATSGASTVVDLINHEPPRARLVLSWNDPHRFAYIPGMVRDRPVILPSAARTAAAGAQSSAPTTRAPQPAYRPSGLQASSSSDSFARLSAPIASQRSPYYSPTPGSNDHASRGSASFTKSLLDHHRSHHRSDYHSASPTINHPSLIRREWGQVSPYAYQESRTAGHGNISHSLGPSPSQSVDEVSNAGSRCMSMPTKVGDMSMGAPAPTSSRRRSYVSHEVHC